MPRVSSEHREHMRKRIIDAAIVCIGQKGFAGTSMNDIVTEAGVSAGAVYLYFKGKSDIGLAVGRSFLTGQGLLVEELTADSLPTPAQLFTQLSEHRSEAHYLPVLATQVWAEIGRNSGMREGACDIIEQLTSRFERYFVAWFQKQGATAAQAHNRATLVVPGFIGLLQGGVLSSAMVPGSEDRYSASASMLLELL
ncbi:putative HTH-type transcriptional regulator YfiR [Corynebacterium kalinowskii]|uniref:HTH-type transcriptional regulator YfiR n=1 Tax=Corynebacterium kalinowskii TaxID=2675216 RepID=A0A6B8W521_9CORY|nr:TetR/AcrR family transcriptional regulator [Corynebacterium kalinowskii]QGU02478.1 putative HTH-type transcriptional regulator YfiR [Corynebacterium kalinowskii]